MNSLERIEEIRNLEEEKKSIERKLNNVNEEIRTIEDKCNHVGVLLNFVTYNCVICKQPLSSNEYMQLKKQGLMINASDYLTGIEDYSERLDNIQTMYLGLCRQYPEKTDAEIVEIFNQMIQEAVNIQGENSEELNPKSLKRTN